MSQLAIISSENSVTVLDVHQITEDLAVLSFRDGDVRFDNVYNVPSKEVMDTLLLARAGKTVTATLTPAGEANGHPGCTGAVAGDPVADAPVAQ